MRELKPAPGVIAYDVNVPLYSDGAEKERFIFYSQVIVHLKGSSHHPNNGPASSRILCHFLVPKEHS